MDSPEWISNKGATINLKKYGDNNCYQYSITVFIKSPKY